MISYNTIYIWNPDAPEGYGAFDEDQNYEEINNEETIEEDDNK